MAIDPDEFHPCSKEKCEGAATQPGSPCLEHVPAEDLDSYVSEARRRGFLDARGVFISDRILASIQHHAPRSPGHIWRALFDNATFPSSVSLNGVHFASGSSFADSVIHGHASFRGAKFGDYVSFQRTEFLRDANFQGATFGKCTIFSQSSFGGQLWLKRTAFGLGADFSRARLGNDAYLRGTRFGDGTRFDDASFGVSTFIGGYTKFGAYTSFIGTSFGRRARLGRFVAGEGTIFRNTQFEDVIGEICCTGMISFDGAKFSGPATLRLACPAIEFSQVDFSGGAQIFVRGADISLPGCRFGAPSLLTTGEPLKFQQVALDIEGWPLPADQSVEDAQASLGARPRLVSVAHCDVTNLVVEDIDVQPTRFASSHNLDRLRLLSSDKLGLPQRPHRTSRRMIAEEQLWWHKYDGHKNRAKWYVLNVQPRWEPVDRRRSESVSGSRREPAAREEARQIELTYRALRKGLEDSKDEPGAADFYYGEMEMRRHASRPRSAERLVLSLYWLLSGYGLRASRALLALTLILAISTTCLIIYGFGTRSTVSYVPQPVTPRSAAPPSYVPRTIPAGRPSPADAVIFSVTSATAILRQTTPLPLTRLGQLIEVVLRILGPVLIGLAAFSIRGRIKR